jgi:RND family efflux transporter MFP subunit
MGAENRRGRDFLPRMCSLGWGLGLLASVLLFLVPACGEGERRGAGADAAAQAELPPFGVETAVVRRGSIQRRISASASLVARRESRIGPEVQGRILRVFVDEGDRVAEGALLFQIDPEPYEFALHQAEARLDLARAERSQGESDLGRARALKASHVVAQQEIDRLITAVTVAHANERQAEEALALARRNLERTLVRTPYAASVVARLEDEGTTALVQPQTIVVVVQETSELEAVASIPESEAAQLRGGDPAWIHLEGVAEPIETRISAVGDAIDPATRTFEVKMRVPNAEHAIKAGVFAEVELLPQARDDALLVPADAIRSEDGRTRVFTIQDGRATPVSVRLGLTSETEAEVLTGVSEGTEVIVGEGARDLAPGMRVEPRNGRRGSAVSDPEAPPVEEAKGSAS